MLISLSKKSYILRPLNVTTRPILSPSLNLKAEIDFLALAHLGFCPVTWLKITAAFSMFFLSVIASLTDKKNIEKAAVILSQVTGQKPKWASAKKSISAFKLREGDKIGLVVTLRGRKMYDFFERLISIVMPRFRDFHGVKKTSFDGNGNYTLGFTESTVFPEIDPGKVDKIQGFEVSIVTSAANDKSGFALLKALGMPFVK